MTLRLSTEKARQQLQWFPVWDLERAIERTMAWYWAVHNDVAAAARQTADDIAAYEQAALERELGWAR
jgi:CDP-glucose 4,6-dehydratase